MKKILLLLLLLSPLSLHALSGDIIIPDALPCENIYTISGPEQVRINSSQEFALIYTGSGKDTFTGSISYKLRRAGKVIESVSDRQKYLRYFQTGGEVVLEAGLPNSKNLCTGIITKKIRVYDSFVSYVGRAQSEVESSLAEVYDKNNILYKSYPSLIDVSADNSIEFIWNTIEQSDILIIGTPDILGIFSEIVKLQKTKALNFSQKQIYIISDYSRSFLSKVLASSISQINATKVSLISEDQFYGLITRLSSAPKGELNIGEGLSYAKVDTIYSLSRFLEFLVYAGFSYQLLAFLLVITFIVLLLNIFKQVIGFDVFGIYYPILFAITVISLWVSAFLFIGIGLISILIVNTFSKRVHLLLHAKRALLISVYILVFLLTLGLGNFFEIPLIRYTVFDNPLIIFPIFITIILADKIFQEEIHIWSKVGIIDFLQYGIITGSIYYLLDYKTLQYFLISYPDVIMLIVLLNIVVWRYTWLQIFEYFRFAPLFRKLNEEE